MNESFRAPLAFALMAIMLLAVGIMQSWSLSLAILNLCLISAIMALGVNIQWGYAGLVNVGLMGFTAIGGLAAVLVSQAPVKEAWAVGGSGMLVSLLIVIAIIAIILAIRKYLKNLLARRFSIFITLVIGMMLLNMEDVPKLRIVEQICHIELYLSDKRYNEGPFLSKEKLTE